MRQKLRRTEKLRRIGPRQQVATSGEQRRHRARGREETHLDSSALTLALSLCILLVQTSAAALYNHCRLGFIGQTKAVRTLL